MIKNIKFLVIFLVLFSINNNLFGVELLAVKTDKGNGKVTRLEGTAAVFYPGDKSSRLLKLSDSVQEGCEIYTSDKSRLEITFVDKTVVRFAENTNFKLIKAQTADPEKREIKIFMSLGKVWSNVRKTLSVRSDFEISSENAVAGVRGTIYRINIEENKATLIKVYDGEVRVYAPVSKKEYKTHVIEAPKPIAGPTIIEGPRPVSMQEWTYIIKSMQQIYITADGKSQEPKEFTEEEDRDKWVDWNKERDKKIQ
jgi:FecR protein